MSHNGSIAYSTTPLPPPGSSSILSIAQGPHLRNAKIEPTPAKERHGTISSSHSQASVPRHDVLSSAKKAYRARAKGKEAEGLSGLGAGEDKKKNKEREISTTSHNQTYPGVAHHAGEIVPA